MVDYTLKRSKRKTIAIHIINGAVEVRAPMKMPKESIERFVTSKDKWIEDKLAKSSERVARRDKFEINYGDHVIYMGGQYPVEARVGGRIGFDDVCFYVPPGLLPDQVKFACAHIYRLLAKRVLIEKVNEFAKAMGVRPAAVKINGAKTRWGSCSSRKSLNFSWMIMMADNDIIDYVVVHELAHITEMNHSARFWALVGAVLPDYTARKAKLKQLQQKLSYEDWG